MADRFDTILLFGPPGSGKGTQGKIIANIPGFFHSACGDIFRRLNPASEMGRLFIDLSSRGELVPDDVTVKLWFAHINAYATLGEFRPQSDILVLDGIPRTVEQAKLMEEHIEVLGILHLVCFDEGQMIDRLRRRALKENRIDDAKESVIRHRWNVYNEETAPVLGCYSREIITNIDSIRSPVDVLRQALDVLVPLQHAHLARRMARQ